MLTIMSGRESPQQEMVISTSSSEERGMVTDGGNFLGLLKQERNVAEWEEAWHISR